MLAIPAALMAWSATALQAASFSYSGDFTQDDDVQQFSFLLANPGTVTMRTWSFAGGVNFAGRLIPAGGFSPILSLFGPDGLLLGSDSGGPPCGDRNTDPASGACWDSYLNLSLAPGAYTLVLTEYDNQAYGPALADGFARTGQGNFTGPSYLGTPGAFVLMDGTQRTSAWAVDIVGVDQATSPTPEPASTALIAGGLAGIFLAVRRRRVA